MSIDEAGALKILQGRCRKQLTARDEGLLRRAIKTLYGNIIPAIDGKLPCWGTRRSLAPAMPRYVGHWNWDSAFCAMALAKWDVAWAREQADILFEAQHENGCLPNLVCPNGAIIDNRSQPPIWFWAYREIDEEDPNDQELCKAYRVLSKYEAFWCARRKKGGLFHYDADEGKTPYFVKFESGWDTSPRWDEALPDVLWPIDLNCYMVLAYRSLAYMAERLKKDDDIPKWRQAEVDLSREINRLLWHEEQGAYCDTRIADGTSTEVLTPASFMPLFVGIADVHQADCMARLAEDAELFYPMMPSVSYNSPAYSSGDYFRGPTWLNIDYPAIIGLKKYGYIHLAEGYRERILDMCAEERRDLFEYYDSRTGEGRGASGYGWTAAFIIRFILNED